MNECDLELYPVILTPDADGGYVVTCRDVQGATTQGDTLEEALYEMADALAVALEGYTEAGRALPKPSEPQPGERLVRPEFHPRATEGGAARR
ncbi:type II toxin-antitoxin system HicB family antitoxin [Afifella aestuarii]|uniref:type II toxin-antitoxin system HicB family antitoxin n=1 Tax=Afifella aestuarii TaxID=1909496 RepID=UPI000FE2FB69|nr:type II toxin-antitoxin system HicB family antitoxin [Afifella aestuarii]